MKAYALPLGVFFVLASTLALALQRQDKDPNSLPSPLLGKPVPAFELGRLDQPTQRLGPQALQGQVWILNAWASWCVACRKEHPVWLEVAAQSRVTLIGFNYQDQREAGLKWLERHGNPYEWSLFDPEGRTGIDLGIVGVPETFVIDKKGRVREKYAGAVTAEVWKKRLWPLVQSLQRE